MGTTFNFAPDRPISANRRARVAQNVRRICGRMGIPQVAVQRAVRLAGNDLLRHGDDEEAVVAGIRCAVAEERRLAQQVQPWPKSTANFVGDVLNALSMVSVLAIVLGLIALALGWRP